MSEKNILTPHDNLQLAFDAAKPGSTIFLEAGVYRQKILLRTPGLQIVGAGIQQTTIIWDDYANKLHEDGKEYNTFRTYTMAICANDVSMRNLSIVNDAGHPEEKGQEVALSVLGNNFTMEHCRLTSTQDTLFTGPLPDDLIKRYENFLSAELRVAGPFVQQYNHCLIEGSYDFIFGCAEATFESCEIRSVYEVRQIGYVAAPAHAENQTSGLSFRNCHFTCEPTVPSHSVYLARPWRDYGLAAFEHCQYGPHIAPEGFDKWENTNRDKTARFFESPTVIGRVPWIHTC